MDNNQIFFVSVKKVKPIKIKKPNDRNIISLKKSKFIFLIILSLFGIIQFATITEEAFHVMHGKGAKSVCLDFNLKINDSVQKGYMTAHTVFDFDKYENLAEFYTWRELSEKIAGGVLYPFMTIGVAFIAGFWLRLKSRYG